MTDGQIILLADVILIVHFAIAVFITWALPVIWVGGFLRWRFVTSPWFRLTHVGLMGFVVVESLLGKLCPLTIWEAALRRGTGTGGAGDGQSFVAYWVGKLLFHDLSEETYTIIYILFFLAVVATFFLVPIRWPIRMRENSS